MGTGSGLVMGAAVGRAGDSTNVGRVTTSDWAAAGATVSVGAGVAEVRDVDDTALSVFLGRPRRLTGVRWYGSGLENAPVVVLARQASCIRSCRQSSTSNGFGSS